MRSDQIKVVVCIKSILESGTCHHHPPWKGIFHDWKGWQGYLTCLKYFAYLFVCFISHYKLHVIFRIRVNWLHASYTALNNVKHNHTFFYFFKG